MKVEFTEREKQWLGSAEEEKFFEEMMGYADTIGTAKTVVRKNQKQTAEYWDAMSVLCKRKAQLLRVK
ncbi:MULTISPECIES: hypothetical protein [unclassified Enterobacter cloacae complex]|uniref:hypothetical protein n=1 Tax=unclassified Enterobacter cloacae complex TaxID=2757714 RepID=UPI00263AF537|nr:MULTISPECIES: hypothetical protein [unclassified Enterobacter cloacae complex]MDN4661407.1 hypothetical protein [Enterobacter cloacae complex sp. 2023EL-00494]MDN4686388.1 hypothetical protein [Enterobacter cloacae complex sp. 2023EL-00495]